MSLRSAFGRVFAKPPRRGYYIRFRLKGREYERAAGPTKTGANALLARIHAGVGQRQPIGDVLAEVLGETGGSSLSLRDAIPLYLKYAKSRKKPLTLRAETPRFNVISREPFAKLALRDVHRRDVSRFVDRLAIKGPRGKPCAGATINRYLASISALYRWAIREESASQNPAQGIERFNERGAARELYLDADEAWALIEACSERLRPVVTFALATGCRRGEILSLRWKDVQWKRGEVFIRAENSKTSKGRPVPLPESVVRLLERLRSDQAARRIDGADFVFEAKRGAAWTWTTLRREFELAVGQCDTLPPSKAAELRFHDLRHTYGSLAVQNGVPLQTVSRILGHTTLQMTMRYAHWCGADRADAARAVWRAIELVGQRD